jgi:hypothetical protein
MAAMFAAGAADSSVAPTCRGFERTLSGVGEAALAALTASLSSAQAGAEPGVVGAGEGVAHMESLTSGTLAGTGSFRCEECGYVLSLAAADALPPCPVCGGAQFTRASLFGARFRRDGAHDESPEAVGQLLAEARAQIEAPGQYLVFQDRGRTRVVELSRDWTRIGRSLAADVRLDDPTISRRHALIVRGPDGLRLMDDRSLNGVFVNDERVEWRTLADGDEIVVGRYRLHFVEVAAVAQSSAPELEAAG